MKCRYSENDIALFVEGDLEPAKAAELEIHLVTCEACRELEADVRESQTVLKSLRQETVSSAALSFVRNRVLEEVSKTRVRPVWGRWVYALAGAMFVAVLSVSVILHSGKATKTTPLLGQGGVAAPSNNIPVPLKGADGVVRSGIPLMQVEPSAPAKVASRHSLDRRSHPSFSKEGNKVVITERAPSETPTEVVVKLLTDDPNIVIYWLVDQKNGGTL
jgi:Putative zinc-finger